MPSLPRPDDPLVVGLPESLQRAYIDHIIPAEEDVVRNIQDHDMMAIHIRILGALLIHAPTGTARERVAQEISSAVQLVLAGSPSRPGDRRAEVQVRDKLSQLGELYLDHFIRVCECPLPFHGVRLYPTRRALATVRKAKARSPGPSYPPSKHRNVRTRSTQCRIQVATTT